MFHTSRIELSMSALRKNITYLKKQLGKGVKYSSVVKGNAYGHGIPFFVPMAEQCGVRHFAVFSADEALAVLQSRTEESEIMIMGAIDNAELAWALENGVSFWVFESHRLKAALKAARQIKTPALIHLELETGLNRTGLHGAALRRAIGFVERNPEQLKITGICTHYAGAESTANYLRIRRQIQLFNELYSVLTKAGINGESERIPRHTACSAAALAYPETIMDMARIGIAQYGYWPGKEVEIQFHMRLSKSKRKLVDPLDRVIRWSSRLMSVKTVKRGEYVGYGMSSLITRRMKIATVPVGYFHGFSRDLSNRGHVLVHGRRCPVVGMVNMNIMTVDVTDIPGVKKGSEVVIIGRQGDNTISVGAFGEMARSINYEILVTLPSEIPRVVVDRTYC